MTHFHTFTRDDGMKVTVEYEIDSYGSPGGSGPTDPPDDPPEVSIVKAWIEPDGENVELTIAEEDRCVDQIIQNIEPLDYEEN